MSLDSGTDEHHCGQLRHATLIETALLILEDVDAATTAKMVRNSLPVAVGLRQATPIHS
jgi:hypothetical protein